MERTLILHKPTSEKAADLLIDGINDLLSAAAANGLLDDSEDDAWEWKITFPRKRP